MTKLKEKLVPSPELILQIMHANWAMQVIRTALELNIFPTLNKHALDANQLAKELNVPSRGLEALLDALVGISCLNKSGSTYEVNELSKLYLVPDSSLFLGKMLAQHDQIEERWKGLTAAVRSGRPVVQVNQDERAKEFFPALAEAIFPLSFGYAQRVAEELRVAELPGNPRVLDVAAGSGVWTIPMALENERLHVDALDFQPILEVTKRTVTRYGIAERYSYIAGNWRDVEWKKAAYDICTLGHILHSEGWELSKQLVQKCFEALKPGGTLVIAEMIPNDQRTAPPPPLLFAVNMFLMTETGCVFSEAELRDLLNTSGFTGFKRLPMEGVACPPVVIAKRAN